MKAIELDAMRVGFQLPETSYTPSATQLFLYAASTWNAHRIHFDHVYATEVEKYEGVVIQGPLVADFFIQHVLGFVGSGAVVTGYEYTHRGASYLHETLVARAEIVSLDAAARIVKLVGDIRNGQGEIVLPAEVTVRLADED